MTIALILMLAAAGRQPARPDPLAPIIGTWVRDSATGPDDQPPKEEAVILSRTRTGFHLIEKASLGGAVIGTLDCGAAPGRLPAEGARGCTWRVESGLPRYTVFVVTRGKRVQLEQGTLRSAADGTRFADEFEQYHPDGKVTRHRSVYRKVPPGSNP